jgi:hypothetical protein
MKSLPTFPYGFVPLFVIDSGERENPYGFSLGMEASPLPPPPKALYPLSTAYS